MSVFDVLDRPTRHDAEHSAPPASPPQRQPDGPGQPSYGRRFGWLLEPTPETIVTALVVAAACTFTFVQLQPSHLLSHSTPAGGDMGAHVWQPAYLRDHILTHFRLTGWAPSWYAGFPSLVFYFPLPSFLIVILNVILPYQMAFKLVSVCGLVALPVAAWAFGRLSRMPFPGPACLAAATLPFLFSREFTIYGGNIASTLAGEFSFSIAVVGALVFLGLVARGLETGRYRAWAAVVLTCTGLCHLLPTIFAILGALVLTLMRPDLRRWLWTVPALAVSACLAAFWSLPFLFGLPYATDMGYEKLTQYTKNLFPPHLLWLFFFAAFGAFVSLLRRHRVGTFLAIMAALSALIFRFAPQARLWNARVLPFWFLCLYLLAGVAIAEGGAMVAESIIGPDRLSVLRWTLVGIPLVAVGAALLWVGFPLRILPFGHLDAHTGQYRWLGVSSADKSFIPDWVKWNYSGYESADKARRNEYFGLVKTMSDLGKTEGCGRAMWEYEPELDQMGTPDALMLLPYWTNECIGSMEGLYYESSATTPYHFLNAAELSLHPSNPVRGLSYPASPDVAQGVAHLQMLGVKYYMALTPETQGQADANSELRLVATSGPWPVTYYTGNTGSSKQRTWKIYEIANSDVVSPLLNRPVVMKGVAQGGKSWLDAAQKWYLDPTRRDVFYAASGPVSWARVSPLETNPPRVSQGPTQISNIATSDNSVSFNVDNVGVPVLVKVSYFPNWKVAGAKGPWRVAPNLMVVVPTSHHVRLHYGYTSADLLGILLSLIGVAGVVWLAMAKPLRYRTARHFRGPTAGGRPKVADVALTNPYLGMETALAGAFGGTRDNDDLDAWWGYPSGLDGRGNGRAAPTAADAWVPPEAVGNGGPSRAGRPGEQAGDRPAEGPGGPPAQPPGEPSPGAGEADTQGPTAGG
jgi:hypothetical protein